MIHALARLFRLRLAILNGVTALGGYFLFPSPIQIFQLLAAFCGVILLAMGGSALNQVLERDVDALMDRTRFRPLPTGEITPFYATFAGVITILAGSSLLALESQLSSALGLVALAWYLMVYTSLKRRTSLALPIGALSGAVPPLIGWCMAGGAPSDYRIIILSGLFFIWQIPHFWLLQRHYQDDYRRAGISMFPADSEPTTVPVFMYIWVLALVVASLMLLVLNIIDHKLAICYALFTLLPALPVLFSGTRLLMGCYNVFPLMLTLIFALQKTPLL